MTPEQFREVRDLFEAALDKPADQRSAWLLETCPNDPSLRDEVERLLRAHALAEAGVTLTPPVPPSDGIPAERSRVGQY